MQPSHIVTVAPQPVQVLAPSPVRSRSRHSCAVKSVGILQMINSGLAVVLGIAVLAVGSIFSYVACGIWGGLLFYLPAGILGVLSVTASAPSRKGLAIACMVMSILSAMVAGGSTIYFCAAAFWDSYDAYYYYYGSLAPVALDSLLAILSFFELVVTIVASVYCCLIMSEMQSSTNTVVQYVSSPAYPNMTMANQPAAPYATNTAAPAPAPAAPDYAYGGGKDNFP